MSLACALGLDRIAFLLATADVETRAFWGVVLVRADRICARRDERVAGLIAQALAG